eukprot:COSAG02_NODE_1785_length_10940_cov_9.153399_5_plen_147_part_00
MPSFHVTRTYNIVRTLLQSRIVDFELLIPFCGARLQESLAKLVQIVQSDYVSKSKLEASLGAAAAEIISASDEKTRKYVACPVDSFSANYTIADTHVYLCLYRWVKSEIDKMENDIRERADKGDLDKAESDILEIQCVSMLPGANP